MPSIPQSLLWISLVVLWLFVLVPMLISKRENVRRTSDVALATRVLNTNGNSRLRRRSGPAAGHHSDPHWKHDDLSAFEEDFARSDATTDSIPVADPEADKTHSMVVVEHVVVEESEYLDVEVVEMDSGALPIGASGRMKAVPEPETAQQPTLFDEVATPTMAIRTISEADFDPEEALTDEMAAAEPDVETEAEPEPTTDVHEAVAADEEPAAEAPEAEAEVEDGTEHDYEYVDDTSGVEAASEAEPKLAESRSTARRSRYES